MQKVKENDEDSEVFRRGVGGVEKRGDLDINAIDLEINKDIKTRKLVKLADFDFQIKEINKFVSSYSPYKIFQQFIMLFQADTLERKENDQPQQYFYELDPETWTIKLTIKTQIEKPEKQDNDRDESEEEKKDDGEQESIEPEI